MPGNPTLKIDPHAQPPVSVKNGPHAGGHSVSLPTAPANVPHSFTMTDQEVASELGVSANTIRQMNAVCSLPRPLLIGSRRLRWLRSTLVESLAVGCPDREAFEAAKKNDRTSVTKE